MLTMEINSAARAQIPVLCTSLVAAGLWLQGANGQLAYIVLIVFFCSLHLLLLWLPRKTDTLAISSQLDVNQED